jgi:molybdopterin/thiamine biosynthesis adenylyltransferase
MKFDYNEAFSRNLGVLTKTEQDKIKQFKIAIPGMGGVGGSHLISLVRQGFENFIISDEDEYEMKNFNRQFGADMKTIGEQKTSAMKKKALEINPNCNIEILDGFVTEKNLDHFLKDVDFALDSIDFFCLEIKRKYFNRAHELNIPLMTAGPIGFGTAYLIFLPTGPTYDQYFNVSDNTSYTDHIGSFYAGLCPKSIQKAYVQYEKKEILDDKKPGSSIAGVSAASAAVVTNVVKILLKKGNVKPVPYYHQMDFFMNKYVCKKLWFGNKNPIQKIKIQILKNIIKVPKEHKNKI